MGRNGNGTSLGQITSIPFPSQNIWLFPIRPKPRAGQGMHSHPYYKVKIKIPSLARLDPGMCCRGGAGQGWAGVIDETK